MTTRPEWSAAVLAILCLLSTSACQRQARSIDDPLLADWLEAAGGFEAWDQVHDARFTVTTVWFDSTGSEVRRRPRFVWIKKGPERSRIERQESEGYYVQAHDGVTQWATLDGVRLPEDHKATAEVLYVARDVFYWFGLPYKLGDAGVHTAPIPADSTGRPGVRVTFGEQVGEHPGDRWFYYFDAGDPFPAEVHYIEQGYTSVDRTRWSDFQQAGPITYVAVREFYNDQGVRTKQLIISDVLINPGIDDSVFSVPR